MTPRLVTPLGPLSEYDDAEREAQAEVRRRKAECERLRRERLGEALLVTKRARWDAVKAVVNAKRRLA